MAKAKSGSVLDKYKEFISLLSEMKPKPFMSIGPLSLNIAAGDPRGIPMGKFVQLVGRQSSGKSTLAMDIIAQYQRDHQDQSVLYLDFERSLDLDYAVACGVDPNRLLRAHPDTTEIGLDILEELITSGEIHLAVIDSIAAARPGSEGTKSYTDSPKIASSAGILTRFCYRMTGILDNTDSSIILINQLRKNMSMMSHESEVAWGGMAVQFAVSLSVQLTRIKTEDNKQIVQALVRKNKLNTPQRRTEFKIIYGQGIDHEEDLIQLCADANLVSQSGSWFVYKDIKAQGMDKAKLLFPIDELRERLLSVERSVGNGLE